jgi:hypothetical protein
MIPPGPHLQVQVRVLRQPPAQVILARLQGAGPNRKCVRNIRWVAFNRPISVHRFSRRAVTLCPQLCMGIHPGARFPARSAEALPAIVHGHFTQAINRNRPMKQNEDGGHGESLVPPYTRISVSVPLSLSLSVSLAQQAEGRRMRSFDTLSSFRPGRTQMNLKRVLLSVRPMSGSSLGLRVYSLGFRVWGLGFRVQGFFRRGRTQMNLKRVLLSVRPVSGSSASRLHSSRNAFTRLSSPNVVR